MACQDYNAFKQFILEIDQKVEIDRAKDKKLRYNVWDTTNAELQALISKMDVSALKNPDQSPYIKRRIESAILRIKQAPVTHANKFQKDIFSGEFAIEKSIALHEIMESVKGESDKARNLGLQVAAVSDSGVLPALPRSRVAASIGRKIAYQKGYRFKRATRADSAAKIESLYYDIGNEALLQLEDAGYVNLHDNVPTIMDYLLKEDLDPASRKQRDNITTDVLSVSLNEKTLKIKPGSNEANYFLNRTVSDIRNTELGVAADLLRLSKFITQPATIVLPDTGAPDKSVAELSQWDDGINKIDPTMAEARKKMYDKPLYVHDSIHGLMQMLNEEAARTGQSAIQIIMQTFGARKKMVKSLFGLKRSDDFSIDKKESVAGQNLSKSAPMDDLVESYDAIQDGSDTPVELHLQQKLGRNGRMYYPNSVLNPHASKQSRYMLTPGEYTVDAESSDSGYLSYQVAQALNTKKRKLTYQDITGQTDTLSKALEAFSRYEKATTLSKKLKALGPLAHEFEGTDYVLILTALKAVTDIRNPVDGKITTQFTVSADATASGGTITFMQALGTNENVVNFFHRIGMFKSKEGVEQDLDDLYGLMSNAISGFVKGEGTGLGPDIGGQDVQSLLQDTLDMLFVKQGDQIRDLSKDPTMTFIYGQRRTGATVTLARSLADRVIDNLEDPDVRTYLARLFDDKSYLEADSAQLKNTRDLYKDIVDQLKTKELPQSLFDIMEDTIKDDFLLQYQQRSDSVWKFVMKMDQNSTFKVLPAGAVMAGKTAANDLNEYGMPISKKVEVLNTFEGKPDTVLTRRDKVQKTVFDVSTTHSIDAAQMFHSIAAQELQAGVMSIHDDVRGTVADVRAMEAQYVDTTIEIISKYDVHQQMMDAIAAQSPEIASLPEFIALKEQIDTDVKNKAEILNSGVFNKETDALIGDGKAFEEFQSRTTAKGQSTTAAVKEVQPKAEPSEPRGTLPAKDTTASTAAPEADQLSRGSAEAEPLAEQDFGAASVSITEGDTTVTVSAQEYWNDIKQRLAMVERLKVCLKS